MIKVEAYPHARFNQICEDNNWNDENVEDINDVAFISIIGTSDVQREYLHEDLQHWFKSNHSNVLNLEFDDVAHDIVWDDYKAYVITPKQAQEIIDFIEANLGKRFYIHCRAGVSRSGAICDFIKHNYDYYKDSEGGQHIRPNVAVLSALNKILWQQHFSDNSQEI